MDSLCQAADLVSELDKASDTRCTNVGIEAHSDAFSKGGGSKTSLDMLIFGLSYTPPISVHEVDTDSESIADSYSGSEKVTSHLLSPKSKVGRPLGSRNKTTSSTVVRKVKGTPHKSIGAPKGIGSRLALQKQVSEARLYAKDFARPSVQSENTAHFEISSDLKKTRSRSKEM